MPTTCLATVRCAAAVDAGVSFWTASPGCDVQAAMLCSYTVVTLHVTVMGIASDTGNSLLPKHCISFTWAAQARRFSSGLSR